MPQVSYPGVYIEEVPSGVHTITGVSTSIAAFFGRATKGPINKAVRCFSISDFIRNFGKAHKDSDLADSVKLFFANGGTDCYVIRLAKGAEKAQVGLKSLDKVSVLLAVAKAEGLWGNTLRLEVDYNTSNPDETFNLTVIHESAGKVVSTETFLNLSMNPSSTRFAPKFVTQGSDLIDLQLHNAIGPANDLTKKINLVSESFAGFSQARRPLGASAATTGTFGSLKTSKKTKFDVSVNDGPYVSVDLKNTNPSSVTNIKNGIKSAVNTALATVTPTHTVKCQFISEGDVKNLLTITSDSGDKSSVRVRRASSNDISAALMLGVDQGGVEFVRWSNFRPAPTATFFKFDTTLGNNEKAIIKPLNDISDLAQSDITKITIDGEDVVLDNTGDYNLVTTTGTKNWYVSKDVTGSPHENNDGVREKLRIIAQAINANVKLKYKAEVWGYHLAIMATEGTVDAKPTSIASSTPTTLSDEMESKVVRQYSLGEANDSSGNFIVDQKKGDDGKAPTATEYIGNSEKQTGFYALDVVDIFNLMVLPGDKEVDLAKLKTIWGPASTYCQKNRAFLLIDPPSDWIKKGRPEVVQNTTLVNVLRQLVIKDHSAVFYPRLKYASNGTTKKIGPSGAIAGLMARIDATRGVWKAPAGLEADIRTIQGLEVKLTDMENGVLNKLGANCLRVFPSGFVNWGARTLAGSDDLTSEWKYIPIRRFALFLEESLFRGTKWVVFEPNDEPLWAKIRLNINAFMLGLFRQGAFQGSTPDKAFYVKCDGETTTQNDRNLGIVNIEVGFAPLKPAEFVVIKIQQIAGDL
jgi:phage tail sheath protein FI